MRGAKVGQVVGKYLKIRLFCFNLVLLALS